MQFTGSELVKKRNFYTQNENFGVSVDFSLSDASKKYEFGLSGTNLVSLIFQSGVIKYNDLFVGSYLPNNDYSILIQLTNQKLNLIKDSSDLVYGMNKQTGDYNYFFFSRENAEINAEFDFVLSGQNLPKYTIESVGFLLTKESNEVVGKFFNQAENEIRIFNSTAQNTQNLSYEYQLTGIAPSSFSLFKFTGDYNFFDFSQTILTNFSTNFGDTSVEFQILDVSSLERAIIFDEISSYSFGENNSITRNLFYTNYSGGLASDSFNSDLEFVLKNINGTGDFEVSDFAQAASFTGLALGSFLESGIVTGFATINTGNSLISGNYNVFFDRFQWATGLATGFFTGFGTGLASGLNYTGAAYGPMSGIVIREISNGSGTFVLSNSFVTGFPFLSGMAINYTGYANATGFIDISDVPINGAFYIGVESNPIVNGIHYFEETGFVSYISGNSQHKVSAYIDGSLIKLTALESGEAGNGIFVRNFGCNPAISIFSPVLTGGVNFGETGFSVFNVGQPFSGFIDLVITGSGDYTQFVSGNEAGVFKFRRTFSGDWGFYTGLSEGALEAVPLLNDSTYSGFASLPPNSSIVFEIRHNDSEFNEETSQLSISGDLVLNPINQLITR